MIQKITASRDAPRVTSYCMICETNTAMRRVFYSFGNGKNVCSSSSLVQSGTSSHHLVGLWTVKMNYSIYTCTSLQN